MRPLVRRTAAVLGVALLSTPAAAHGVATVATGLPFPLVVVGVVAVSLLGGGLVLVAYGRLPRPTWGAAPLLVATLGVVYLARDAAITDCGACADAALGAVTLHRGLEGVALATVYAADAALGLLGAAAVAAHAAAKRHAVAAVCLVQAGFVGGVVGRGVVGAVPPAVDASVLALAGGVLLVVGAREARRRHAAGAGLPA